jgi:hypothetical protein
MTKPHVAIIGSGPAGLLAAWAVKHYGGVPYIFSPAVPPIHLPGAQYLHRSVPGLTEVYSDGVIKVFHRGSELVYSEKVYSGQQGVISSWGSLGRLVPAWDLKKRMQQLYEALIPDHHTSLLLRATDIEDLVAGHSGVINTAPAHHFCFGDHMFASAGVTIIDGAADGVRDNTFIYNGRPEDKWYRSSRIFGYGFTEYPARESDPPKYKVEKPLETNCNCHTKHPSYRRAGRYGRWKKTVLVHDGFETAERMMRRMIDAA